jgi:putative ABC transport system permease protein
MLRNYLKIAFRIIFRNKIFSAINIFGLAISLTVSILILVYIFHELSYDKFHENKNNIYRLVIDQQREGKLNKICVGTAAMGIDMQLHIPQIEKCVRFHFSDGFLSLDDKVLNIRKLVYTDSTIFDVFSFNLVKGNPKTILDAPNKIVLSESVAKKLFGDKDPVGKTIILDNNNLCMISGVVQDPPSNSHIQFEALISMATLYEDSRYYMDWDGGWGYYSYFKLQDGIDPSIMNEELEKLFYDNINHKYEQVGTKLIPEFQALKEIYLFSNCMGEMPEKGNLTYLIVFSVVAVFILLTASINFINLTTARATKRAKEVGLRKVVGATKQKLIHQFLGESMLLSIIALIIAIILIEIVLPSFNQIIGKQISLYNADNYLLLIGIPVLVILIGFISGSYPAFYLSSFKPVDVLKGVKLNRKGKNNFRHVLVLVQFTISIVLIFSTIVIFKQIQMARNIDLGYNNNDLLVINLNTDEVKSKYKVLKEHLKSLPEVKNVSASSQWPGGGFMYNGYIPEGFENSILFSALDIDYDYFKTMEMEMVEGRNFDESFETDKDAFIVNEALLKKLGWETGVGNIINRNGKHEIIGVVKDFNYATVYNPIEPLVIKMDPYMGYSYLMVKLETEKAYNALLKIEKQWKTLNENIPLSNISLWMKILIRFIHQKLSFPNS